MNNGSDAGRKPGWGLLEHREGEFHSGPRGATEGSQAREDQVQKENSGRINHSKDSAVPPMLCDHLTVLVCLGQRESLEHGIFTFQSRKTPGQAGHSNSV